MSRAADDLLQERLMLALVALKAAHDEEHVCSCPFERCLLSERWAKLVMA